jgi:hypothetical protein
LLRRQYGLRLPFAVDDFVNGKGWRFQVALFIKGDLSGDAGVVNGAQGGQIVGGSTESAFSIAATSTRVAS